MKVTFTQRLVFAMTAALVTTSANAEPYRLRGDVLASALAPAGLLALSGDGNITESVYVEALVWAGRGELGSEADALVALVAVRLPEGFGEVRLGRMVMAAGSVRPVHADGAFVLARLPIGGTIQVFGGLPVVAEFGPRKFDWLVGARAAQPLRFVPGQLGVAFIEQRQAGRLSDREVGFDLGLAPVDWIDLSARAAWDLLSAGVSEAIGSASMRFSSLRIGVSASHRSPSRILPATSLFTVLGDVPSQYLGGLARYRVAPRLDLELDAGVRRYDESVGEDLAARAVLRLDRLGEGAITGELRRRGAPEGAWTGARVALRVPLPADFTAAAEVELVRPDDAGARGDWWPWALVALGYRPLDGLEIAVAAEASASPERTSAFDALLRVGYVWGRP